MRAARDLVIGVGRGSSVSHQARSQTTKMSRVGSDGAQPRHTSLILCQPRHLVGPNLVHPLNLTVCFFLISTIGLLMQISPKFNFPTLILLPCPALVRIHFACGIP